MTQVQTKEPKQEIELSVQQLEKQGLVLPKNITDTVFNTLSVYQQQGTVSFPQNYSVGIQNYKNVQMHQLLMLCLICVLAV